jgi:hypothetical protein
VSEGDAGAGNILKVPFEKDTIMAYLLERFESFIRTVRAFESVDARSRYRT